jgi:CRISPR/Cas system CMR subunit Cmr4 (Cas7 group RAMP superfamily)
MIDDNFLANPVVVRYQATGKWKALTALHPGGENDDFETNVDMALLRSNDGNFYVPGASIAGAVRSYLAGSFVSRASEPREMCALFGGAFSGDTDYASLLTVFDARALDGPRPLTRDGVRINPVSGIADDTAKYDFEVLPAGTTFKFIFQLVVYQTNPFKLSPEAIEDQFLQVLGAFREGHVRLGAKTRRGLGRGELGELKTFRLSMRDSDHVRTWLNRKWESGTPIGPRALIRNRTNVLRIEARLKLKTSVLIRSAGQHPQAPEMVHLTENGKSLLSGTSLAGVLRQRCLRIANTMGFDGKKIVSSMFGPAPDEPGEKHASRVRVEEQELEKNSGGLHVQGRVSIDRFTGGALEAHLFDQAAFWPDERPQHASITIELDLARPAGHGSGEVEKDPLHQHEPALLLQAFKDIWLGDLTLGGEAGAGRGVFNGVEATFSHPDLHSLTMKAGDQGITVTGDWAQWNKIASLPKPGAIHV